MPVRGAPGWNRWIKKLMGGSFKVKCKNQILKLKIVESRQAGMTSLILHFTF
jgi:hypothetical protein